MSEHIDMSGLRWQPTWTQAMTDFRGENDEPPFVNVTVRMTVRASIGGDQLRVELSNRFGDEAVSIERAAIGVRGSFVDLAVGGQRRVEVPRGASRWTDPVELTVRHRDEVVVDLYLPGPTAYATANGFAFDRSASGDFVGATEFPVSRPSIRPASDGTGWSLPPGGPFLRTVEVAGAEANEVIVCLGGSSTVMGWPQYAAALLPADAKVAIVNRGIAGNRIRFDAPPSNPSWGPAGLSRFDEDVLGTNGVTGLVIAYNSNDWGLPGNSTSMDEMPTLEQLIAGYQELMDRARARGLAVIIATVTPLDPMLEADPRREGLRRSVNDWIRSAGHEFVDFDAAIRDGTVPTRLATEYAAPDRTHPNINGQKRLAGAMVEVLTRPTIENRAFSFVTHGRGLER